MNNPLFSVLIANYNNGKYLMDAVDSIYNQTYKNWEIILVDDGSTDNSLELYKQLEENPRIHIFFNKENKGCGFTKRRCIDLANGDLCGFVDADDKITPDALSTMASAHVDHPECSLIYSQFYYTNQYFEISQISSQQCQLSKDKTFLDLPFSGAVSHFATFKIDYYHQTEGISPLLMTAEDIDLYLKLEEVGNTLFIPKPLYYYRTNTGCNISLGDNSLNAMLWEIVARMNAFHRRGINPTALSSELQRHFEHQYHDGYCDGCTSTRNTLSYRIGNSLLKPFKKLQQLFRHA